MSSVKVFASWLSILLLFLPARQTSTTDDIDQYATHMYKQIVSAK